MISGEYLVTASKKDEIPIPSAWDLSSSRCAWRIVSCGEGESSETRVFVGVADEWRDDEFSHTLESGDCEISVRHLWRIPTPVKRLLDSATGEYLWIGCCSWAELTTPEKREDFSMEFSEMIKDLKRRGL